MINILEKFKNYQWLRSWRPYFVIFVFGFLLYSQTLFFNYTYLDDQDLILNKQEILSSFKNIPEIFSSDAFLSSNRFYYRPLLNISLMVDAHLGGDLPFFYHLSNIFLHIIAATLLFIFLVRISKKRALSFFLSLIFLVHPVLTQAVAWIPGRNDSLLTVFILLAFISFFKFLENPRFKLYLFYLLFFFFSLLTKETAIFLPVLVAFYFLFVDSGKILKSDKYLLILGSGAVAFVWFLMRSFALGREPINYLDAFSGIINIFAAILVNFGKIVLPFNLSVFPILQDSTIIYGFISSLVLVAFVIYSKYKKQRIIIFSLLWFLFFLLPSFILLNTLPDFLEHRLYLSLIGFLILISEIDWIKNLDFSNRKTKIYCLIFLLFFAGITFFHSMAFRDKLTFWQAAVKTSPHSPLAQKNLGAMYYLDGNFDAAYHYYSKSLELNPNEPMIHNNLGLIYELRGDEKKAEEEYLKELNLYPNYDNALLNLGNLYYKQKKTTEARYLFESVLRDNPYNYEAYRSLINLEKTLR